MYNIHIHKEHLLELVIATPTLLVSWTPWVSCSLGPNEVTPVSRPPSTPGHSSFTFSIKNVITPALKTMAIRIQSVSREQLKCLLREQKKPDVITSWTERPGARSHWWTDIQLPCILAQTPTSMASAMKPKPAMTSRHTWKRPKPIKSSANSIKMSRRRLKPQAATKDKVDVPQ